MRFLRKIGIADFEKHYVEDFCQPLEERYINYKIKLTEGITKEANNDIEEDDMEK